MKHIDVRFNSDRMQMLQSMVGKMLEKFRCDPFEYSTLVYGLVGLYVNEQVFKLDNFHEIQDFFGHQDDVAMFKLHLSDDSEIHSLGEGIKMVDTPIACKIRQIRIVDENQQLFVNGEQTYDVWVTRGVIFDLEDGREVSFEKSVWFSEFIDVRRGYGLLEQFQPADSFLEEWEENPGYVGKCYRQIRVLSSRGIETLQDE